MSKFENVLKAQKVRRRPPPPPPPPPLLFFSFSFSRKRGSFVRKEREVETKRDLSRGPFFLSFQFFSPNDLISSSSSHSLRDDDFFRQHDSFTSSSTSTCT